MSPSPSHAMILAAGLGLRMRPLSLNRPKPLLSVAGRTMLDRVLDHLDTVGVTRRVVNTHWLGETIHQHLAGRPNIVFSDEPVLLETGGGVFQALPLLGPDPFFVCNADIVWTDGPSPSLKRLADAWDDGAGDFFVDATGRASRRRENQISPTLFAGVQILHPRLFNESQPGKFSLNKLYDRAEADGRLYAIVHDGGWYHVGTPDALVEADALIRAVPPTEALD